MKTVYKKITDDEALNNGIINEAADIIKNGGLVAFPTETVYGLGANALSPHASEKIYAAKGRPQDNPLIVHISDFNSLREVAMGIGPTAGKLMKAFWPGPLTLVFKKRDVVPYATTGGLDTVAVRLPDNDTAISLISHSGFPIAAPSANLSGRPSPTRAEHVLWDMEGRVDMVIDGGESVYGLESTIVDVSGLIPKLLRPGAITLEMLNAEVGFVSVETDAVSENAAPPSPGMKYRHYSPKADMFLIKGRLDKAVAAEILRLMAKSDKKCAVLATDETLKYYADVKNVYSMGSRFLPWEIGRGLFACLRRFDDTDCEVIFSEAVDEKGIGLAVMNRLTRACGHKIIDCGWGM